MASKIVSAILSALFGLSVLVFPGAGNIGDIASTMIFGLPVSNNAINETYSQEISDSDVISFDGHSGIVRNKIILILDPSVKLFRKYSLFAREGLKAVGWCTPVDLYVVSDTFSSASDLIAECKRLESNDEILLAAPITVRENSPTLTPNDPFESPSGGTVWDELNPAGDNWWLEAINARQAWDYLHLLSPVTLGVIDSGVDTEHPDLKGQISFPGKKFGKRNRPTNHGTHVCGIMAAVQNNAEGISGILPGARISFVDWSPEEDQKWNTTLSILFGFVKEVKAGARVINLSVGKSSSVEDPESELPLSDKMSDGFLFSYAMASLLCRKYDFLVVESAGNGNSESKRIDAVNSGLFSSVLEGYIFTGLNPVRKSDIINRILLVGSASNRYHRNYRQSYFSNVGPEVEICAPGNSVYSCNYEEGKYAYMSGTSMAAPVAAAIGGLVWSVNNSFTGDMVKEILISSCTLYAQPDTDSPYLGNSELLPIPMVDAKSAVEKALQLTYNDLSRFTGTCPGAENGYVLYGTDKFTVLPDGSYDFLAVSGDKELVFFAEDGKELNPSGSQDDDPAEQPAETDTYNPAPSPASGSETAPEPADGVQDGEAAQDAAVITDTEGNA